MSQSQSLTLTGEYVEGDFDPETGERGPAHVKICVNGQDAFHLRAGDFYEHRDQKQEVEDVFIQFLQEVALRRRLRLTSSAEPA